MVFKICRESTLSLSLNSAGRFDLFVRIVFDFINKKLKVLNLRLLI